MDKVHRRATTGKQLGLATHARFDQPLCSLINVIQPLMLAHPLQQCDFFIVEVDMLISCLHLVGCFIYAIFCGTLSAMPKTAAASRMISSRNNVAGC
jgi:hypothetical protein